MYNVTLLFNGCGQDAYGNSDFCGQRNTEEPSKKPTEQGEKNLNIGKEMEVLHYPQKLKFPS